MDRSVRGPLIGFAVCAAAGVLFTGISTYDYVAHLDRQVHAITCALLPGLSAADTAGSSGCHAVLMSPYSALFRSATWGGLPIALPGLAIFAFLLFRAADVLLQRRDGDPDELRFLLWAGALPLAASVVYALVSAFLVGALCKMCLGVYAASLGVFVSAWLLRRGAAAGAPPWSRYGLYAGEGALLVVVACVLYLGLKPAYPAAAGACGELLHPEDKYGARVRTAAGGVPAVEVVDPLCPACKGLAKRLAAGGFDRALALEAVMFPLDKDCNWMVPESVHPGACAAAEAVLCGGAEAGAVLQWIYAHQDELHELGRSEPARVGARIGQQFPQVARCIGKPEVKARLNKALRWAVSNSLPVLTPQLFVNGHKICDEDTDLGLDYVLTRTLAAGGRAPSSHAQGGSR